MNKNIKQLKAHYENNLPVAFTEEDKQNVFQKIKATQSKSKNKAFYPKALLTVGITAFAIFIGFVITNIPLQLSTEDNAKSMSNENEQMEQELEKNDAELGIMQDESSEEKRFDDVSNIFNPETIQFGDVYSGMTVTEVQREKGQTTILFSGNTRLSGEFQYRQEKLQFNVSEQAIPDIPIATSDNVKQIPLYFKEQEKVEAMYQMKPGLENKERNINITAITYFYSEKASRIELEIDQSE
ncbi:hypothetical protein [Virgibacillus sp. MG-45]|uniref:hypothetical protein n=1 Tax=Virgibacillus sp. MG-45 TaxID=3102791 RepID=UPI002ED81037